MTKSGKSKVHLPNLRRAEGLRQGLTPSEEKLWTCLRARRLGNVKFRRQHCLGPFIVDFYCYSAQLVIEIDGEYHNQQEERDHQRDLWLNREGLRVLRFTNDQVDWNLEIVLARIKSALNERLLPSR